MKSPTMIERVRQAAQQRVIFLPHAVRQMARPDRMIEPREVLAKSTWSLNAAT